MSDARPSLHAIGLTFTFAFASLLLASGCASTAGTNDDGRRLATLRVELDEADARLAPSDQFQRSWISTDLFPSNLDEQQKQAWTPDELHIYLRTQSDVHAEATPHGHVLRVDSSLFSFRFDEQDETERPVMVRVDRPGGSFVFRGGEVGQASGRTVYGGTVRVGTSRDFRAASARLRGEASTLTVTQALLAGLDQTQLRRYAALHARPTLSEVIELVEQGLSASDVQQLEEAGYRFSVAQLIALQAGGVLIGEAVAFRRSGFRFDHDDLTRLAVADLSPSYAAAMKSAGFGAYPDDLLLLHASEMRPAYAARMRDLLPQASLAQVIELAAADVDTEAVATFQKAGYVLTSEQMLRLQQHDVSADDALTLRQAGYAFTLNELVILRKQKVSVPFVISLVKDGFELLSAEQIVRLHQRQVTPEMVHLLREQHLAPSDMAPESGIRSDPGAKTNGDTDADLDSVIDELSEILSAQPQASDKSP